ncbi:MAG: hypothetical protein KAI72_03605, partial [Candidatus Pacebacteria bacterium]|nr:hypothetical protein [Candidatus Paceibacterota bacterium]
GSQEDEQEAVSDEQSEEENTQTEETEEDSSEETDGSGDTDDSTVGDTETASTTDDVEDETEGDEAEDESEDENSSGEEEDMTEQDETEVVGDDVSAGDQEASEELTEKVIDEVLIRAEIEKVVEARVKKEYEEKMRQFLSEQEENEQKDVSEEEVQNFQSIHGFDDVECEVLSNNEIYCRRGEMLFDGNEKPEVFTGVFAQEEDDDSEIIFQHGGQVRQITDNTHSDINPVYDEKGDIIVWQALVNGRWQIMVHDLAKGITEQISGGGFNNINPHASGGIVVWQGWAGSNWDIFYAQHITLPDQTRAWKAVQVTDNVWPDVDPRVVDGVVLWEAYIGDSWQIFSYETTTGKLVQVSQGKGDNRNPRLVVLWDSIEDGVAQTIQYDISTNERAVVGTGPVPTEDPFS